MWYDNVTRKESDGVENILWTRDNGAWEENVDQRHRTIEKNILADRLRIDRMAMGKRRMNFQLRKKID